ncbi:FAD dependent oxidoreductase [Cucurbitaria berberidis CBS 394.84]|uniref:FAD dependent oxidoreductase n=1 Tax=Cucurbitaria berberidis CBS 394.84 TaxID=1168544 RepID=A0A9P4GEW0_9PLEO|nr:FAD dependent oxidoreductase [Cucurbitaria berberidis CBS 394.84]KAF1844290.1 FAD dependent oxidoreductase [Cucurbitaria berberidis CBS 394.84]
MSQAKAHPAADFKPSLPLSNCQTSYWSRTTESFRYLHHNSTSAVPESVQYVIIGSGISGALSAFKLVEAGVSPAEILVLEAREAVSGSSGRNAGHCRPDAFRSFAGYAAAHGKEQALQIVETENRVLKAVDAFVTENEIACEFRMKATYDVNFSEEVAADEAKNIKQYTEAGGSMEGIRYYTDEEARAKTGFANAIDAYEWQAASIHPAKLTHWLLSSVIGAGVKFWTHCPATAVSLAEGNSWVVSTPRGQVHTRIVIHATNAYAGLLLPQLSGPLLTPVKVQVQSFDPPSQRAEGAQINATYALRYSMQSFYAAIQTEDASVVFCIARPSGIGVDESSYEPSLAKEAYAKFAELFPEASHARKIENGVDLEQAWTGLLAFTPDKVPYVGAIPELPGQYICAGFNGHGMANIFACAPGMVKLILGGTWEETALPECYQYRTPGQNGRG